LTLKMPGLSHGARPKNYFFAFFVVFLAAFLAFFFTGMLASG